MMAKWVRSKYSEEAERWEVVEDMADKYNFQWVVRSGPVPCGYHFLPKGDYIECPPPERWEVCTREVVELKTRDWWFKTGNDGELVITDNHRWAWSEKDPDALVIKRRVEG